MTSINIHFEAIWTKADNAKDFEGTINDNIEKALQEQGLSSIEELESSQKREWNDRLKGEKEKKYSKGSAKKLRM